MNHSLLSTRNVASRAALATLLLSAVATTTPAQGRSATGAVFTASNDAQANTVLALRHDARGRLAERNVYPTGGLGSGGGLGNQGALALDRSGRHLLVVNAGSDSLSSFLVRPRELQLVDVVPSGGVQPISVTVHGDLVYVLNEGGGGNISGLQLSPSGSLTPLAGSSQPLSVSGADPAQISFSPDGRFLVVTEKSTDTIVTYAVGDDGLAGDPVATASSGVTPFGFSFGQRSRLLVSEAAGGMAGLSTVSSYDLLADGTLQPITAALPTTQSAACWLVTTGEGRFAYTTNTGSDSITGLGVNRDGSVMLLDPSGVAALAGDAPIDAAVTRNGRFLYVLNSADASIIGYEIGSTGELTALEVLDGLPASVNGLAAN